MFIEYYITKVNILEVVNKMIAVNKDISRKSLEEHNINNKKLSDLVELAQSGNQNSYKLIIEEMYPYNKYLAKKFTNRLLEVEDLMQVGNVGLYQGIQQFNTSLSKNNVKGFLKKCMLREVIDSLKALCTQKRKILRETVSSNTVLYNKEDENEITIADLFIDKNGFIEDIIEHKESEKYIEKFLESTLPQRQKNVFLLHVNGYSYKEIGYKLDLNNKQVDNALQSAKRTLKKALLNKTINNSKRLS